MRFFVKVHDNFWLALEECELVCFRVTHRRSLILYCKAKSVWSHVPMPGPYLEVNLLEVAFFSTLIITKLMHGFGLI